MNRLLAVALVAAPLALPAAVSAQDRTTAAPKPAAKAPPQRIATQPARAAASPPPPVEIDLPPAGGEQTAAAALTYYGEYQCEFNQRIVVDVNPKHDAYVDVRFGRHLFTARPVLSHTGALRLEDVRGQMLVVQIATKSMIMDTRAGKRVVDDCKHEKQVAAAQQAASLPGIGIAEPAR